MGKIYIFIAVVACLRWSKAEITAAGCGDTKNCYRYPENCEPSSPTCKFVSWRPSGKGDSKYTFEISGESGNGTKYMSFALALISDMKDADMYYCDGKKLGVGALQVRRLDPTFMEIGPGVTDYTASTVDGVGQCTFTRAAKINRVISEDADHDFDIENHCYYLLVASGNIVGGNMVEHNWRVHLKKSYDFSKLPGSGTAKAVTSLLTVVGFALGSMFASA